MLPEEAIKDFQQIYKKVFKKEITWKKAKRKAENLIRLFEAVYNTKRA